MTVPNTDPTQITKKNRYKALYAFFSANQTAVNNGTSILREQPNTQISQVITQRQIGCPACTADASTDPYPFRGSGGNGPVGGASPGQ